MLTDTRFEPTLDFAKELDLNDPLSSCRDEFYIPAQENGQPHIYFCGNSLGCQPRKARVYVEEEMLRWEQLGVDGHFEGERPWVSYHMDLAEPMANIVGANKDEVTLMNTLTVNLHLMMVSFYRPEKERYKILIEADAFPSDIYAIESQLHFHGYDPAVALIKLRAREGEHTLRTEDILEVIEKQGNQIALILLGGLNYYTGQVFDMEAITTVGKAKGCTVGFDLAHAVGNVPLKLHDWGVDFACWCTYKYVNSGPGGMSGVFIHERYARRFDLPRFAGWWGHDKEERFLMEDRFKPMSGAEGWQLSNAPILILASLRASLELFEEVGMDALRAKSIKLTAYLEKLLRTNTVLGIELITPTQQEERGCQLSLLCHKDGRKLFDKLTENGVICDWREPDVIRVAPVPFYNTFEEVWRFVQILNQ